MRHARHGVGLPAAEDVGPHRVHLRLPHRLGVGLLRQLVEREADRALHGRARLLRGTPVEIELSTSSVWPA
jgi:hypothetical protein